MIALSTFVTACGGGGGGGSSSSTSSTPTTPANTYCVNSPVQGCLFNTTDGIQFLTGWWKGTRTYAPTGGVINAYAIGTNLGAYQIYLGDAFNQGSISGTVQIQGSAFTTVNGSGNDTNSTGFGSIISPNSQMNSATGGVVTKSILGFTVPGYAMILTIGKPSSSGAATFRFTYNTDGDLPLSNFVGTYSGSDTNGPTTLVINSTGQISYTYKSYVSNYPSSGYGTSLQTCVDNFLVNPSASISSLSLTLQSANNCGYTDSLSFYSFLLNGTRYMVALGVPNAPVQLH